MYRFLKNKKRFQQLKLQKIKKILKIKIRLFLSNSYLFDIHLFHFSLKKAEVEAHEGKLRKFKIQRDALSEQIKIKTHIVQEQKERDDKAENQNPHARSESLMVLYKKEKAKQLYLEQLQLMKQKREFEGRIAEIDKQHSLDRLIASRKE